MSELSRHPSILRLIVVPVFRVPGLYDGRLLVHGGQGGGAAQAAPAQRRHAHPRPEDVSFLFSAVFELMPFPQRGSHRRALSQEPPKDPRPPGGLPGQLQG